MKDFRSRTKQNNFFKSRFLFVILFVFLILFVRATVSAFQKKGIADEQELKLQQRYDESIAKKEKYITDLERLQSDRGLEEEFRTRFNVVRDGETMIKIVQ